MATSRFIKDTGLTARMTLTMFLLGALFVGLARASGIAARDVYGIRVADSATWKSLGKSGDITKAQHCRAEFHDARCGWVPVDPADVRKVILEEQGGPPLPRPTGPA